MAEGFDATTLSRVLGAPVTSYDVAPIDPDVRIHSVTGGVYRIRTDVGACVVKVVRRGHDEDPDGLWVSGAEPTHRNYWKREWLAFDSGLLDSLPGRLRAPRRLLTAQASDSECWIWMEDVRGRTSDHIELDDYGAIACALGSTQGAFAAGDPPPPTQEWLSRRWLRGWVQAGARNAALITDDAVWQDTRLAPLQPLRGRALAVWAVRDELLGIVESAPQTLVHLDFWPHNLFVTEDDVVAIDWSQIGIGAVGQDLDQLTLDAVWMHVLPDVDPRQLERRVLPAYLHGLAEAGFDVDESDLRRWYAAAAAAHYVPMLGFSATLAADPEKAEAREARHARSFAEIVTTHARVLQRAVELGEWALGDTRQS